MYSEAQVNAVTGAVIGAAIAVHRALGPGLLESIYEECLCRELDERGVPFRRQWPVPLVYRERPVDISFRVDLAGGSLAVVEVKAVERLLPVHEAQLLSYMRLLRLPAGLLINVHVAVLRDGVRRDLL